MTCGFQDTVASTRPTCRAEVEEYRPLVGIKEHCHGHSSKWFEETIVARKQTPPPSFSSCRKRSPYAHQKAAHLRTTGATHEREIDLLTRKVAKADDAGLVWAAEVEVVIADWPKVVRVEN
ncbi:hypothetical protein R3P38DRAFT_3361152 [Favolaschia claudopus]|uniref:Uncharacterized protein n=1 Tax=Favolaschia claudopus TaxID=2862362 RepID=A0AAW0AVL4_9AGAR